MKNNEQMYKTHRWHQAGRSCQHAKGISENGTGVSQKVNTTISTNSTKYQQSQKKKLSMRIWRGSPIGKKYWGQEVGHNRGQQCGVTEKCKLLSLCWQKEK